LLTDPDGGVNVSVPVHKPLPFFENYCGRALHPLLSGRMVRLTKQEQMVLCFILGLLLTGWAVKTYRTAHPAQTPGQSPPAAAGNSAEH
jgi:hypothetical protein